MGKTTGKEKSSVILLCCWIKPHLKAECFGTFRLCEQRSFPYSPTFFALRPFKFDYLLCVTKRFLTDAPLTMLIQLLAGFYFSFISYENIHYFFNL